MTKKKSEQAGKTATKAERPDDEPIDDELVSGEESDAEDEDGADDGESDDAAQLQSGAIPPAFSGERHVLIVEPDEERRKMMVAIASELMPNATLQEVEDDEEGEVALEEDEFQMVVMDLQVPGFSTSEFVRTVHNNESIVFVALSLDNFEPGDEKNRLKLDSLRKLFE